MSEQGKIRRNERSLKGTVPMRRGLERLLSNKSKLSHNAGMGIVCPICCTMFYRAPSHVARVDVSYCSRACQAEGRKVRIVTNCVTCGIDMERTPSDAVRVVTCSRKCSSLRRRSENPQPQAFALYKKAVESIRVRGACSRCSRKSGPWIVRGLNPRMEGDEIAIDKENAVLICQSCHFAEVGVIGGINRQKLRATA
jgi:5-methylcytosine-specific restriction endonuclease McrA